MMIQHEHESGGALYSERVAAIIGRMGSVFFKAWAHIKEEGTAGS